MRTLDLDFAAECTLSEGWTSETRKEIEGFFKHQPSGCFVAEKDSRKIGICIATHYGESGFVGELIVVKEMRGQGIGRELLEHAIDYLHGSGIQNVFLDGVPAAVPLYERIGFRKVCRSLRFAGRIRGKSDPHVRPMKEQDLETIFEIDQQAFGADRSFFLKRRRMLYSDLCRVLEVNRRIVGFVTGRRGQGIVSLGPWVAQQSAASPATLLEDVALNAGAADLRLGVLETNVEAVREVKRLSLAELPDPPWRMVLGSSAHLGASGECYAIGSPAKG